jgi:hypothetical protein
MEVSSLLAFAAAANTIVLAVFMLTSFLPLHFRMGSVTIPLLSFALMQNQAAVAGEIAAAGADVNAFWT